MQAPSSRGHIVASRASVSLLSKPPSASHAINQRSTNAAHWSPTMGLKRAGSALLIPLRPRKSKSAFRRTDYDRQSFCTHAISNRRLHPIRSASTELRQARNRGDTKFHGRSRYATTSSTPPQHVAVLGGGITGLTTAFYLAKQLPPTSTITIYESSDRLGGWMRTQKVQVNVGNTSGLVPFERGPRTLRGLRGDLFRFDDLVLYDLVRTPRPSAHCIICTNSHDCRYVI